MDSVLEQPLQFLKGVGPRRQELLDRLLLKTMQDLLFFFPTEHKDRKLVTPIAEVKPGMEVNLCARILDLKSKQTFHGKVMVEAWLEDATGGLKAVWWNPYVADKLIPHAWGFFSGKYKTTDRGKQLSSPDFEILGDPDEIDTDIRVIGDAPAPPAGPDFGRIIPVYSLRPKKKRPDDVEPAEIKLSQSFLRRMVWQSLELNVQKELRDDLPESLRKDRLLPTLPEAIQQYHFPDSERHLENARRRLAYEELFIISVGVAIRRAYVERMEAAKKLPLGPTVFERIAKRLPFKLTPHQVSAFNEIAKDMGQTVPMNRLLQGDVGCGKTAVAVAAMLLSVAHGSQAALLAPTEVLAHQHVKNITKWLGGSKVKVGFLRGGSTPIERTNFLKQLKAGEIHIAVGTHALLEPGITFKELGLVVIDEQQKFGVEQRKLLREKGPFPHMLVMTATPIPRTLSLTLYGDLDISLISAPPPGRGEVVTKWTKEPQREKVYNHILREARKGHPSYVVLPRIEEGEGTEMIEEESLFSKPGEKKFIVQSIAPEVKGAQKELLRLRKQLPELKIELLHGRLSSEEKDRVINLFREGGIHVLVSTQVIEVGIDLPTATTMVIENAERFGLSSLHQLRGRVGRGEYKSYCFFFGEPKTDEGKERLKAFEATRDGFEIAEADFALRGPGQFFGTQQSGLPELRVANLITDRDLLDETRTDAFKLVKDDPKLLKPENAALRQRVKDVLGAKLGRVDVG